MTNSKQSLANLRYKRDVAIAALIRARRAKRKSRPLLEQVLTYVAQLRGVRGNEAVA